MCYVVLSIRIFGHVCVYDVYATNDFMLCYQVRMFHNMTWTVLCLEIVGTESKILTHTHTKHAYPP